MHMISFVVAIYNVEKYLKQCIESLRSQQCIDAEIILVDDGSTDSSYDICCSYQRVDHRIKVIHQENQGANAARNKGLEYASGKWLCFVDGDDWVSEQLTNELADEMSKEWDIIIFSYNKINGCNSKPLSSQEQYYTFCKNDFSELQLVTLNRFRNSKFNYKTLDAVSIWNKLYNREFLLKNKLRFVPGMPKLQDLTFNLNVYEYASNAVYIHKHLYNYRINNKSVSHRYQEDIINKFDIINNYIKDFVQKKYNAEYQNAYYERLITHLRTIVVLYLCNPKNKKKYRERKELFCNLLNKEPYKSALMMVELNIFPTQEKWLSIAIKHQWFLLCSFFCGAHEVLKKFS